MVSADDVDNGELGNEVEETGENMDGKESRPAARVDCLLLGLVYKFSCLLTENYNWSTK